MENIKIFIASKVAQDSTERMELSAFFLSLNNCYVKKGIYFTPVFLEDMPDSDATDRELADSSLAVFIFHGETEDADLNETFKTARDKYNQTGKPKIAVYEQEQSAASDHEPFDEEGVVQRDGLSPSAIALSGFYANKFNHIDTLKFGVLMQIKQLELAGIDIILEDGKALQGYDVLMRLDNVESVAGFEELQQLKQEHAELESRYHAAKGLLASNPDDKSASEEFYDAAQKRGAALADMRKMQTQLYTMMQGMYEQTSQGNLSKRQVEGYRLTERGLIHEARDVLDFYAIVEESQHDGEIVDQAKNRALVHVQELMQLVDLNAALLDWDGVDECYRAAMRLEEKHSLPRKATLHYVSFLAKQRRHKEGLDIGERLRMHYQETGSESEGYDAAILFDELGLIYSGLHHIDEAEGALKKSLELRQKLANAETYSSKLGTASVYNNLGSLYYLVERYEQAADAYETSLKIQKELVKDHYAGELAYKITIVQGNLAIAYFEMQKYGESVEVLESAMDLTKKMIAGEPENIDYRYSLSLSHTALGETYCRMQRYIEAEEQYMSAHKILAEITLFNPDQYKVWLASNDYAFGSMYLEAKRYPEAEAMLISSLDLFKTLADRNITISLAQLTDCYKNLGCLYKDTKRFAEAEAALRSALRLYDDHISTNPVFVEEAKEIHALLDTISKAQLQPEEASSSFSPEEREVALLLTEGMSQREISRKLGITALEFSRRVSAIREKVTGMAPPDPVIDAVAKDHKLTRREADILRYLQKNNGNDIIAAELYLSEETVRIHVRNVLRKLGVDSRQRVSAWLNNYSEG